MNYHNYNIFLILYTGSATEYHKLPIPVSASSNEEAICKKLGLDSIDFYKKYQVCGNDDAEYMVCDKETVRYYRRRGADLLYRLNEAEQVLKMIAKNLEGTDEIKKILDVYFDPKFHNNIDIRNYG